MTRILGDETTRQWLRYAVVRRTLSLCINLTVLAVEMPGMGAAPAVLFLLAFSLLRKYAGGFHASSVPRCLACSLLQAVLCAYLIYPIFAKAPLLSAVIFSGSAAAVTFWLAPLLPAQLYADHAAQLACRTRARRIVLGEFFTVSLLLLLDLHGPALGGSLGMDAAAISLLIDSHLKKRRT